jgi:hypothetical protein
MNFRVFATEADAQAYADQCTAKMNLADSATTQRWANVRGPTTAQATTSPSSYVVASYEGDGVAWDKTWFPAVAPPA